MMRRLLHRLPTPSWAVVTVTLLIAITGWIVASGPGMIDQRTLERRYLAAENYDATRHALSAVRSEVRDIEERLARLTWVDSLVPVTLEAHREGEPLAMGWPEEMVNVMDDGARTVMNHPSLAPLVEDPPAIGVFAVVGRQGEETVLFGETEGQPWCIMVASFPENALDNVTFPEGARTRTDLRPSMLHGCAFVRRFGLPGEQIGRWVEARGIRLYPYRTRRGIGESPVLDGDEFDLEFVYGYGAYYGTDISNRACRAGYLRACAIEWEPNEPESGPAVVEGVTFVEARYRNQLVSRHNGGLLTLIEREFGDEAMLNFWTSDLPVAEAFEEAFGVHPDAWIQEMAEATIGPVRAGPAPQLSRVIPGGLITLAASLVGVLYARRRTIG